MPLRALGSLLTRRLSPHTDKSGAEEESRKAVKKSYPYLSKEAAIEAGFVGKDGTIQWASYLDHVNFQTYHVEMPPYDKEASAKEVTDWEEAVKQQDVKVDEAAMEARFQDWMKEHNRSYSTDEEKARRYAIFKETVMRADKANAVKPMHIPFAPNGFADWTDEECNTLYSDPGILVALTGRGTSIT
uniref:Cathepsin propeptide inhibitor domain-containing protein n=1 Tax=Oryza punctata TaxID=4537 RepID=A0A0E0L468_ORYPU